MGEQIVDGQGVEQRDVAGGGVVADAVGILPKMHVAGAVQLILKVLCQISWREACPPKYGLLTRLSIGGSKAQKGAFLVQ